MYNIEPTFFIYDYETFGLHPASDRPVQFAGIRVNYTLNIIEKIKFFYCRIPNDYLPNPESVLITGITPQFTINHGLNEAEFAYHIFNILNIPNTCIVGYNNIHFDDEFTRNIFYRNFCDPYSWAYQNGNSRWDLLPVLKTFYSLCPNKIKWPINANNQISFRLTDITNSNAIQHVHAHNAKSDVYAALEIMKLLKTAQPKLFQFLYNHRTKNQLKKIIDLNQMNPLLYISNKIHDKHKNFINFLAPIAWHPTNHNILIAYNLSNNIDNLLYCDIDLIRKNLYHHQKKIHNVLNNISLQLIRLNACPILIPINFFDKNHDIIDCTKNIFLNYQYYLSNLNLLKTNMNNNMYLKINKLCNIIQSYMNDKILNNQTHVDNQLYRGFFNYQDQKTIKKIRNTSIEKLSTIDLNGIDTRLKSLLFFYRARNFHCTLNSQEQKKWINYKKNILLKTQKYTDYSKQIHALLSCQNNFQKIKLLNLLKEYYKYFHNTISKYQ